MNQASAYIFVADGRRLVDTSGEFAIWTTSGPDYYQGAVVGYADKRRLYEFSFDTRVQEGEYRIVITRGRRDHPFEDRLIGRTRALLEAAVPAIIDLPGIFDEPRTVGTRVLLAPENLIEQTLYSPRQPSWGSTIEIERVQG